MDNQEKMWYLRYITFTNISKMPIENIQTLENVRKYYWIYANNIAFRSP